MAVAVRVEKLAAVPALLTPQKAADFIGIGRTRLLALLKAKRVRAKLIEGRRYFLTASLMEYLATLQDA
jgi:hypothetical protein